MVTSGPGARPRARRRRSWLGLAFVAPALLVFIVFLGVPLAQSLWYSLWHWDGFSTATWAGLSNYTALLHDDGLRTSFGHAGVLVIFYAVLPVTIALGLTAILSRSIRLRGVGVFRTLLFLPQVIASVVVASTWVAIYSPNGLVNQLLRAVGLGSFARAWLGDFTFALPAIGFIGTWLGIGLCLVLFLSGVSSIDTEVFEAARLDGAGIFTEFRAITLPALRGQIVVALTLTVIGAIKTFDLVYVTTRGGPGGSTTVPAYEAYSKAFQQREVGQAAAIAVVLTALILLVSVVINRFNPKDDG
ncbi:carbohydrate ABC transporter permease [Cellulomonas citrea]|uniref:carbohydrate ABC transporter permease n=1 Tax=Cellulomonas citrea TaxID=1909423 RepID=UPI00135B4902|nr:sugar ABC transporter permease [Cellulomonas citrea]